ncbi:MAG TPA: HTTM domain-containing protein [Chthoniobacterales bacterium]|nr:HTTM domain-containing protein [Chthoniobacterales bacterium]
MRAFLARIQNRAFAPVDIASLVFFRITFGLLMVWEVCRYFRNDSIYHFWLEPRFLFKYYGFSWVHPWPGHWLYIHWAALGVLALFVAFGFLYRISASLMFLSYSYFFLLDEARYVNHYYLICLYCLLLAVVPAHRAFSVDARMRPKLRSNFAPQWTLWLLRFQIAVVYIFAGLVKLSPDWLRGEPMRFELAQATNAPIVGQWFGHEWAVYFVTYGGLLFDLSVVPLLVWRRTRVFAFVAVVAFHLINALWAGIGMFPWLAIAASALFFPPDWPRRILVKLELARQKKLTREWEPPTRIWRAIILGGLSIYSAIQIFLPLRFLLWRGGVEWMWAEHRFSWRMFLVSYSSSANFYVTDPNTGQSERIDLADFLSPRQAPQMGYLPDLPLQFAHYLATVIPDSGPKPLQVQARIFVSINGRKPVLYIDPVVDLAAEPRTIGRPRWLLRNDEPLPPIEQRYRLEE